MEKEANTLFRHALVIIDDDDHGVLNRTAMYADACVQSGNPPKLTFLKSFHKAHDRSASNLFNDSADDMAEFSRIQQQNIGTRFSSFAKEQHQFDIIISWRHPVIERITQLVRDNDIDLIIKAPDKVERLIDLFTSTTEKFLVRDCPAAVWLVKEREWDENTEVLTCLDLDDESEENIQLNSHLLATGQKLTNLLTAEHHTIDCYYGERVTIHANYHHKTGFEKQTSIHKQHLHKLKAYAADYHIPEDRIHCVAGIPDDEIPHISHQLQAEMVIIGNNHDNMVKRTFGDTALTLSNNVPCDILVIKIKA